VLGACCLLLAARCLLLAAWCLAVFLDLCTPFTTPSARLVFVPRERRRGSVHAREFSRSQTPAAKRA
jgi:hypothetical protein